MYLPFVSAVAVVVAVALFVSYGGGVEYVSTTWAHAQEYDRGIREGLHMHGPGGDIFVPIGATYIDLGASCTDHSLESYPLNIRNHVDTSVMGMYNVTYACSNDRDGLSWSAVRAVIVHDRPENMFTYDGFTMQNVSEPRVVATGPGRVIVAWPNADGSLYEIKISPDSGQSAAFSGATNGSAYAVGLEPASVHIITLWKGGELTYTISNVTTQQDGGTGIEFLVPVITKVPKSAVVMHGQPHVTITQGEKFDDEDYAACVDDADDLWVEDRVDTYTVGNYTVTYYCTDTTSGPREGADSSIATRLVTVTDSAPIITITGNDVIAHPYKFEYSDAGATCTDYTDGGLEMTVSGEVDTHAIGTYNVTYSCTDSTGKSASAVRTVNVFYAEPVMTLNGASSVSVPNGHAYDDAGAACTDYAGRGLEIAIVGEVDTHAIGTYNVTYSCTDSTGKLASAVRTIDVIDTEPVMTLNGASSVSVPNGHAYDDAGAACTDIIDGDITPVASGSVDTSTVGSYTITYTCTDTAGNYVSATRTVRVLDVTPPVIMITGSDTVTTPHNSVYSDRKATCTDETDGEIRVRYAANVDTSVVGKYEVVYTCTDKAGNSASATRAVRVVDREAPAITLIGDRTSVALRGFEYVDAGAACTDAADGDIDTVPSSNIDTSVVGEYSFVHTCTDKAGNSASATRTVLVIEPVPAITLNGDRTTTARADSAYEDPGAVCTDAADGDIDPEATGAVDTATPGTYHTTYTCTNAQGISATATRTIIVLGPAPVIAIEGSAFVTIPIGTKYVDAGAVCADHTDGIIQPTAAGSDIDTSSAGTYDVTYTCTNSRGVQAAQAVRSVTVQMYTPDDFAVGPVNSITILAVGSDHVVFAWRGEAGAQYQIRASGLGSFETGRSAYVLEGLRPSTEYGISIWKWLPDHGDYILADNTRVTTRSSGADTEFKVPRIITASAGNVTVVLNGQTHVTTPQGEPYGDAHATCTDESGAGVPIRVDDRIDTDKAGRYTIAYYCSDHAGNAASVTRTVSVRDTAPPVITIAGGHDITIQLGAEYADAGAACTDDVDGDIAPTASGSVDANTPGSYDITYTCTDQAGNSASVTRTVTVRDTAPPVITITGGHTIKVRSGSEYSDAGASCTDDVDGEITPAVSGSVDTGTPGSYEIAYMCADRAGNDAIPAVRTITVLESDGVQGTPAAVPQERQQQQEQYGETDASVIDSLEQERKQLHDKVKKLKKDVKNLEARVESALDKFAGQDKRYAKQQDEIASLEKSLSKLQSKKDLKRDLITFYANPDHVFAEYGRSIETGDHVLGLPFNGGSCNPDIPWGPCFFPVIHPDYDRSKPMALTNIKDLGAWPNRTIHVGETFSWEYDGAIIITNPDGSESEASPTTHGFFDVAFQEHVFDSPGVFGWRIGDYPYINGTVRAVAAPGPGGANAVDDDAGNPQGENAVQARIADLVTKITFWSEKITQLQETKAELRQTARDAKNGVLTLGDLYKMNRAEIKELTRAVKDARGDIANMDGAITYYARPGHVFADHGRSDVTGNHMIKMRADCGVDGNATCMAPGVLRTWDGVERLALFNIERLAQWPDRTIHAGETVEWNYHGAGVHSGMEQVTVVHPDGTELQAAIGSADQVRNNGAPRVHTFADAGEYSWHLDADPRVGGTIRVVTAAAGQQ